MSCYLPLVQRWRKPQHRRDGRGVTLSQAAGEFPRQVELTIRHDHPTLGLGDVAYQRLHQDHTRKPALPAPPGPGVLSLGLPLGISSLKLSSRHRRPRMSAGSSDTESGMGYQTDPGPGHLRDNRYRTKSCSRPAGRKSSLPRKAKIPSSYKLQPRPSSVDADLLLQSINNSPAGRTGAARFAHRTSPRSFMAGREAGEKSSSGNSSGSDLTGSEGSPEQPGGVPHPALQGRAVVSSVVANRGPPPRHLLPARLREPPALKLHPHVVLPSHIRKGMRPVSHRSPSLRWVR